MSEWFKEHAWKACVGETLPRVRIPLSPPANLFYLHDFAISPCAVSTMSPPRGRTTGESSSRIALSSAAGDGTCRLPLVEHQPHRLGLEVLVKLPAGAPALLGDVGHGSGHRIHLSKDVHESGSSAFLAGRPLGGVRIQRIRSN